MTKRSFISRIVTGFCMALVFCSCIDTTKEIPNRRGADSNPEANTFYIRYGSSTDDSDKKEKRYQGEYSNHQYNSTADPEDSNNDSQSSDNRYRGEYSSSARYSSFADD